MNIIWEIVRGLFGNNGTGERAILCYMQYVNYCTIVWSGVLAAKYRLSYSITHTIVYRKDEIIKYRSIALLVLLLFTVRTECTIHVLYGNRSSSF